MSTSFVSMLRNFTIYDFVDFFFICCRSKLLTYPIFPLALALRCSFLGMTNKIRINLRNLKYLVKFLI